MDACFYFLVATIAVSRVDILYKRIPDSYIILPLLFALIELAGLGSRILISRIFLLVLVLCALLLFRRFADGAFGLGDVKLISASSVSFGLWGTWLILFGGSLVAIAYIIISGKRNARIPFAPFIAVGMVIAIVFDKYIHNTLAYVR